MIKITNKDFYKRYKNFSGSFFEWFRACVDEHDVFRFWYKDDPEDETADLVQLVSVVSIGNDDFLLGLKFVDWNDDEEGREMVEFKRLSEVRVFEIFACEEEIE